MEGLFAMGILGMLIIAAVIIIWIYVVFTLVESVRRWSFARERESFAYEEWISFRIEDAKRRGGESHGVKRDDYCD